MKQSNKTLRISIPRPCSEDWNKMNQTEKGRFCSSCQKEVIDFSGLTDKELYHYFSLVETIPCGRFHQSQLNTSLLSHERKSKPWKHLYKKAAAVLAFLSLKPSGAIAQESPQTVIQPLAKKTGTETTTSNANISGTVKNWQGIPVEGADILFNNKVVAKSNKEGKFYFDVINEANSKSSTLLVSFPEMATVVRNYHPAMQSTSYDVVLRKEAEAINPFMGGWISISYNEFEAVDIAFPKRSSALRKSCSDQLVQLAVALRNNPNLTVQVIGFGNTPQEVNLVKKRQQAIKSYLIEIEGIDGDRLKIKTKPKQTDKLNTIEISTYNELE